MSYERVRIWDARLGDVVRKRGEALRVGLVVGVAGEDVMVRWYAGGPVRLHHHTTLERRASGEEIRV